METIRLLARALGRNHFRGYGARESAIEPLLGIDGVSEVSLTYSIIG